MILESKLAAWLQAGLVLYRDQPLMTESVFYEPSQVGQPSLLANERLEDASKLWLPDEWAGGQLRWGGVLFPIVGNTAQALTLEGNPNTVSPDLSRCYQIVPASAAGLQAFLEHETVSVLTAFAQVPTQMPALTIRLERDVQGDTYIGESLHHALVGGVDVAIREQTMVGTHILSIWTVNREATLWLYAWLMTFALASMPVFTSWGLYDVSFGGSDLDPSLQYLAERTYARHLSFTATRRERAMTVVPPGVLVEDLCVHAVAQYAQLAAALPMG